MQLCANAQLTDDVLTVAFEGEITMATLPVLNDLLSRHLQEHPETAFSLNFEAVHAVDDAGLAVYEAAAVFVRVEEDAHSGGEERVEE